MRHRRDQIAEEESHLPFRLNLDALMAARMAGGDHGSDAREYFRIAAQEFPLIDVCNRREVVTPVTGFGSFIGTGGIFILPMLDEILRLGKGRCGGSGCFLYCFSASDRAKAQVDCGSC